MFFFGDILFAVTQIVYKYNAFRPGNFEDCSLTLESGSPSCQYISIIFCVKLEDCIQQLSAHSISKHARMLRTPTPMSAFGPSPLPLGWSEHIAPGGQPYYYNSQTKESTYIRPLPSFLNLPQAQPAKKKEKPRVKTPIPGTEWLRVVTTEGNTFYTHKVKKESVWTVPDEIKDAVANLEKEEAEKAIRDEIEKEQETKIMEQGRLVEVERIKAEVQEAMKRKAEDAPVDEVVISKKARAEDEKEEDSEEESEEEEEWQHEAAAQLAAEAEEERKRVEEEEKRKEQEEEAAKVKVKEHPMPERVDLSIEEAKALFKVCILRTCIQPLIDSISRLYFGKRISTHCIPGIQLSHSSFLTPGMYSSLQYPLDVKPSTSTAGTERESSEFPM